MMLVRTSTYVNKNCDILKHADARQGFCIKVVLTSKAKDVKVETPAPFGTPRQLTKRSCTLRAFKWRNRA